jgi:hypothetical protein
MAAESCAFVFGKLLGKTTFDGGKRQEAFAGEKPLQVGEKYVERAKTPNGTKQE